MFPLSKYHEGAIQSCPCRFVIPRRACPYWGWRRRAIRIALENDYNLHRAARLRRSREPTEKTYDASPLNHRPLAHTPHAQGREAALPPDGLIIKICFNITALATPCAGCSHPLIYSGCKLVFFSLPVQEALRSTELAQDDTM